MMDFDRWSYAIAEEYRNTVAYADDPPMTPREVLHYLAEREGVTTARIVRAVRRWPDVGPKVS